MSNWKAKPLGLAIHGPSQNHDALIYVRKVQPPLVKFLDPGQWGGEIADAVHSYGGLVVGRCYTDDQKAASWSKMRAQIIRANADCPWVDIWEGYNEDYQADAEAAKFTDICLDHIALCESLGKKAGVGSYSCGQPQETYWRRFASVIRRIHDGGHFLALHEYSGPVMQLMAGRNQLDRASDSWVLDDPVHDPNARGWLTLRYRRHADEWSRLGLPIPKIIITESGVDDVQPRPGPQGKGWRSYLGTEWQNRAPFGDYFEQQGWYCTQLGYDENVLGAVGFADVGDGTNHWDTFLLGSGELERLGTVMTRLRPFSGAPVPKPPPKTTPSPKQPPGSPTVASGMYAAVAVLPGEKLWRTISARIWGSVGEHWGRVKVLKESNPGTELLPGFVLLVPRHGLVFDASYRPSPRTGDKFACWVTPMGWTWESAAMALYGNKGPATVASLQGANPGLAQGENGWAMIAPGWRPVDEWPASVMAGKATPDG